MEDDQKLVEDDLEQGGIRKNREDDLYKDEDNKHPDNPGKRKGHPLVDMKRTQESRQHPLSPKPIPVEGGTSMASGKIVAKCDKSRVSSTTGQPEYHHIRKDIPVRSIGKGHITVNGVRLMDLKKIDNHIGAKKTTSKKHSPRRTTKEQPPSTPSGGSLLKYLVKKKAAGHTGEAGHEDNKVVVEEHTANAIRTTSPSSCSTTRPVINHTAAPVKDMKKTFKNLVVPGPKKRIQDNIRLFQRMSEGGGVQIWKRDVCRT